MKLRQLLLLTASAALLAVLFVPHLRSRIAGGRAKPVVAITPTPQVPALVRSLRPAYPFSVIPGGVYSRDELSAQAAHDELIRKHYSDFRMKSAHLAVLQEDRMAYVSYRKNNSIFWTRKQLRIPKGELVLTDGTHLTRARCGNRLSDTSVEPTSAQEDPTPDLMMGPLTTASLRDTRLAFVPPPESGSGITIPPNVFLTAGETSPTSPYRITSTSGLMPPTAEVPPITVLPVLLPSGSPGLTSGVPTAVIQPFRTPLPNVPVVSAVPEPANLVIAGLALVAGTYSLWQRRKRRS
jgi:hypothetical protein